MSVTAASQPAADAAERCLHEVQGELTARGFVIDAARSLTSSGAVTARLYPGDRARLVTAAASWSCSAGVAAALA
ncbi:MAG TPA: hypothetical protein VMV92_14450 [Streptosporangiaceae bacterium]|nr:hypothetical protein [Streptosporangiaceae bacterium]